MLPGVVDDHVAGRGDVAGYRRVLVYLDADHGERGRDVVFRQQAQDLWRVDRAGAVVDRERDGLGAVVDVVHRADCGGDLALALRAVAGGGAGPGRPGCAVLARACEAGAADRRRRCTTGPSPESVWGAASSDG